MMMAMPVVALEAEKVDPYAEKLSIHERINFCSL